MFVFRAVAFSRDFHYILRPPQPSEYHTYMYMYTCVHTLQASALHGLIVTNPQHDKNVRRVTETQYAREKFNVCLLRWGVL